MTVSKNEFITIAQNFKKVLDWCDNEGNILSDDAKDAIVEPFAEVFKILRPDGGDDVVYDLLILGKVVVVNDDGTDDEILDLGSLYDEYFAQEEEQWLQ